MLTPPARNNKYERRTWLRRGSRAITGAATAEQSLARQQIQPSSNACSAQMRSQPLLHPSHLPGDGESCLFRQLIFLNITKHLCISCSSPTRNLLWQSALFYFIFFACSLNSSLEWGFVVWKAQISSEPFICTPHPFHLCFPSVGFTKIYYCCCRLATV